MQPRRMDWVIAGKRYRTDRSTLIAHDAYWNNYNWEQNGRNTFLFRTRNGHFFAQHQSVLPGESDSIKPITMNEAVDLYNSLMVKEVPFVIAFPCSPVREG